MNPSCEGCNTHSDEGPPNGCCYREYNEDNSCPCINCLVKMICNDPCDYYEKWVDIAIGDRPGIRPFPQEE